jgi:hypothetical protein
METKGFAFEDKVRSVLHIFELVMITANTVETELQLVLAEREAEQVSEGERDDELWILQESE